MSQEHTKVLHYVVEISDGSGILGAENRFEVKEHRIIGENSINFVIDDLHFTTIARPGNRRYAGNTLGKPNISIRVRDDVWGSRVSYSLFTLRRKKAATIRKEIEEKMTKHLGFFLHGIDLSVVKD